MKPFLPKFKIKAPNLSFNFSKVIKASLVVFYTIVAALILIPQIDYQNWYPKSTIGTHDYNLGLEFADHKKITIDLKDRKYQESDITYFMKTLYERAKAANLEELIIKSRKDKIEIHIPSKIEDISVNDLLAKGDVEIMTPIEKPEPLTEEEEASPLEMFLLSNYEDSGIDVAKFRSVKMTNSSSGYSYFEIKAAKEEIEKLNDLAEEVGENNIGVVIDGNVNPAWIIASDEDTGNKYPTLAILMDEESGKYFASEIVQEPHKIDTENPDITETGPLFPSTILYVFLGIALAIFTFGAIYQLFIKKSPIKEVGMTVLIGSAILVALKLIPVAFTFPVIGSVFILLLLLFLAPHKPRLIYTILFTIFGAILLPATNPAVSDTGLTIVVTSLTIMISYIISFLGGIYE